mgnify:CR=1 FL=1
MSDWRRKLQIQQCPKCPVSDGRPEKGGLSLRARRRHRAPSARAGNPVTTYTRLPAGKISHMLDHRHARESWGERMVRTLEQSTMRKVYLRLLPFAVLSYILAYIDRINVSFAGLTMRGDLEMSAGTFGFAVGLFYWGYFIFEVPSNVILEKVGARVWIARIMITWGILAGLTAMVTGSTSFAIVRFLLGVAEAGFFPGISTVRLT